MRDRKSDALRAIPLFSTLAEDELAAVGSRVTVREFRRGEVILHEEDTNACMYLVLTGSVKATQVSFEGKETILAMHGPGEFFGEMALLDGLTMPATVSAVEDSAVALISRGEFFDLLRTEKKVLDSLLGVLCARLRESWKRIRVLNLKDADDRMRLLMFTLLDQNGKRTEEGLELRIKLTHQNIADMSGMTRETVTRVIDRWKRDGMISAGRDRYMVFLPHFFARKT